MIVEVSHIINSVGATVMAAAFAHYGAAGHISDNHIPKTADLEKPDKGPTLYLAGGLLPDEMPPLPIFLHDKTELSTDLNPSLNIIEPIIEPPPEPTDEGNITCPTGVTITTTENGFHRVNIPMGVEVDAKGVIGELTIAPDFYLGPTTYCKTNDFSDTCLRPGSSFELPSGTNDSVLINSGQPQEIPLSTFSLAICNNSTVIEPTPTLAPSMTPEPTQTLAPVQFDQESTVTVTPPPSYDSESYSIPATQTQIPANLEDIKKTLEIGGITIGTVLAIFAGMVFLQIFKTHPIMLQRPNVTLPKISIPTPETKIPSPTHIQTPIPHRPPPPPPVEILWRLTGEPKDKGLFGLSKRVSDGLYKVAEGSLKFLMRLYKDK